MTRRRRGRRTSRRCGRRARASRASSARDEQHRLAGVARGAQLRVDELDRAHVDAARRLRREQHRELARPARARSRPSAGCRPRARARAATGSGGRTSKRSTMRRARSQRCARGRGARRRAKRSLAAEHAGCRRRSSRARARGGGGLRECARARRRRARARRARVTSRPSSSTATAAPARKPGDRLDQLALAVALDAGDAEDLSPARTVKRDAVTARVAASPSTARFTHRRARRASAARAPAAGARRPASATSRPTIARRCSRGRRVARWSQRADHLAAAHDGDAVARPRITSSSLWVIEHDRVAAVARARAARAELVDLVRREHRGRLVEDRASSRRGRAPSGSRRAAPRRRDRSRHEAPRDRRAGRTRAPARSTSRSRARDDRAQRRAAARARAPRSRPR